jgi:hypothetical protein
MKISDYEFYVYKLSLIYKHLKKGPKNIIP